MYGIAWLVGAIVVGSSLFVGTFNGAHFLGLTIMVAATVAGIRAEVEAAPVLPGEYSQLDRMDGLTAAEYEVAR